MQSFLTWGATYTIMSHANLFSSLVSIIIVSYRLLTFKTITKYEIMGSFIAITGCAMTTLDGSADKVDAQSKDIQTGNLLSACSSLFATIYIVKGVELSRRL